jgi:tetratricopeptide (TPR) repeat protein
MAMSEGRLTEAVACYRESLRLDPGVTCNFLSLAAVELAQGHEEAAVAHLEHYLQVQPNHLIVRAHLAELLLRLNRGTAARAQYERFIADIQDQEDLSREHLVECHSRVMEIAEKEEDEYGEHLHRGIGLYLLACQRSQMTEQDCELSTEGLLCKAAGELTLARLQRPDEARPCWYLYEVWSHLAQKQPALKWLRAAEAASPLSYLTPTEQRRLSFACHRCLREEWHK